MPGCWLYLVALDETDQDGVWVTEVWDSEEAHRASLQLDHVQAQIVRAMPMLHRGVQATTIGCASRCSDVRRAQISPRHQPAAV